MSVASDKRKAKLRDMFLDLLARRRELATKGYTRRITVISTDNECDAGGEPVTDYELDIVDLQMLANLCE